MSYEITVARAQLDEMRFGPQVRQERLNRLLALDKCLAADARGKIFSPLSRSILLCGGQQAG